MELIVDYVCMECGFHGEIASQTRGLICPVCNTVNDFWLEGEEPPPNHK